MSFLLGLLSTTVGARAAVPVALPLDGSGTARLDGGAALPEGESRMGMYAGGTTGDAFSSLMGMGSLARPWGPVEAGVGLHGIRQRWGAERPPVVDPGVLVFQARVAGLPHLEGLSLSLSGALPITPIKGLSEPVSIETRLAVGSSQGGFRPLLNLGWVVDVRGHRGWAGAGARVDLPRRGWLTAEALADSRSGWTLGAGVEWPLLETARLGVDLCRRSGADSVVEHELVVRLSFGSDGFYMDRDQDGVEDDVDQCPEAAGSPPHGCPADEISRPCQCPFDDMPLGTLQAMTDRFKGVHGAKIYVLELRVRDSGDLRRDWRDTQRLVRDTELFLIGAGVPEENFAVLGVVPGATRKPWSMLVREMTAEQLRRSRGAKTFKEPVD